MSLAQISAPYPQYMFPSTCLSLTRQLPTYWFSTSHFLTCSSLICWFFCSRHEFHSTCSMICQVDGRLICNCRTENRAGTLSCNCQSSPQWKGKFSLDFRYLRPSQYSCISRSHADSRQGKKSINSWVLFYYSFCSRPLSKFAPGQDYTNLPELL